MATKKVSVLIKKCSLLFDKYINQLLLPYNLTNSQFRILMILFNANTMKVRQADIEKTLSMTNPTVTGLIKNLEKNNLVERIENPEDKRSKLLVLTKYAESKKDEFIALADSIEEEMTHDLSDKEVEQLYVLLNKIMIKHKN